MLSNPHVPRLATTVQAQLTNLEESYLNLQSTAHQIRDRLNEVLKKWQEYKDLLDSTHEYLTNDFPSWLAAAEKNMPDTLDEAQKQREGAQAELEKLYAMKQELQASVRQCQNMGSTENLDKADEGVESAVAQFSEQVTSELSTCVNQAEKRLDRLREIIKKWDSVDRMRQELRHWLRSKQEELTDLENMPSKLHSEAAELDIEKLKTFRDEIQSRALAIEELQSQYKSLTQHNPSSVDPVIRAVQDDWEELLGQLDIHIHERQASMSQARALQAHQDTMDEDLENYVKELERIDRADAVVVNKSMQLQKLFSDVDGNREFIEVLRSTAADLTHKLSQHDTELVDDQIRELEQRRVDLQNSIQRKRQGYSSLGLDLDSIEEEADRYLDWLDQCHVISEGDDTLGYGTENVEKRLGDVEELETELGKRQATLDNVAQRVQTLIVDLPTQEKESMENLLISLQTKQNEKYGAVSSLCRDLEEKLDRRKEFRERLDKFSKWLADRETAVEPFYTTRLQLSLAKKQLDKCKSLSSKVQNQTECVNELKSLSQSLQQECDEEKEEELRDLVEGLAQRHQALIQKLKEQQSNLRDCCASRKSFEVDSQKIERWCKETELQCEPESPSDCAVEVLEEQLKLYKGLHTTVQVFNSLVTETIDRGTSFFPNLHESDKPQLQEQLDNLKIKFKEVSELVEQRMEQLGVMVESGSQIRSQIDSTGQWLKAIQEELKQANTPIGHTSQDAELILRVFESIEEKLQSYQPSMAELSSVAEKLKTESQADDMKQLTTLYESILEQAKQHSEAVTMVVGARRSFEELMASQEEMAKEQEEILDGIMSCGAPASERIVTLKNVTGCLQKQESDLAVARDKARQIGKQGTEDDFNTVMSRVEFLKDKIKELKSKSQGSVTQCENIQRDRADFETAVFDAVSWFEQKEDALTSCKSLHFDVDKVDAAVEKHKATSSEAMNKMQAIRERMSKEEVAFEEIKESPSPEFSEKLEQMKTFEGMLVSAISKKEEYLSEAQADRRQYKNSMKQVSEWLRGAADLLDSGYEGLDLDTLDVTLGEFTDYFSEASLCHDEIEQVVELSERLLPTLDENDSVTMQQAINNVNRRFNNVTDGAQTKQSMMEQKSAQWKMFQENLSELNGKMEVLEGEWSQIEKESVLSPDAVQDHLAIVKNFLNDAETNRPAIDNLNEIARDLERVGNANGREVITGLVNPLNRRWDSLIGQAGVRVLDLEEIGSQWGVFANMVSSTETVVHDLENKMRSVSVDVASQEDLQAELSSLKNIGESLERIEPQIARLQSSRLTLQHALPTAEAKISSQEHFIQLIERYERLSQNVQAESERVQEEVDERQTYLSEIDKTVTWFQDTLVGVESLGVKGLQEGMRENLNKLKMCQHEADGHIAQTKALQHTHENKYSSMGKAVPAEMTDKLSELHALEDQVLVALQQKEEELLHIKEDREAYKSALQKVIKWLQKTDMELQEAITSIPEAQQAHQALLQEFDNVKPNLDHLRAKGGDIIKHSTDPDEKQTVQKTLADSNRQWLSLQARASVKTQDLSEASDLSNAVDDVANGVARWAEQTRVVLEEEIERTSFDKLKDQLKLHRRLHREIDPNEDKVIALSAMVKQLEQVCSPPVNMTRVGELKHTVSSIRGKADTQLSTLEDANKRMEEFEKEVVELMSWLEQTRARMTMRDTTRHLKDQLAVQEQLLDDVISNKARAEDVLVKNPEATGGVFTQQQEDASASSIFSSSGEPTLTQASHLMSEMLLLEETAREQRDSLKLAVTEQEKYESEIRQLNKSISEAQQKLLASPVIATSVGALKQQITEHNALAAQIKEYQEKVKEIMEKNRELAMDSAQLSPRLFRKHYLPESAYSDFFSAASHHRAGSPLPSSSPLFFDTMSTFDCQSPRTYNSAPISTKELSNNRPSTTCLSIGYVPKDAVLTSKSVTVDAPIERSSSFGADAGPVGRPLAHVQTDAKVKDLDVSFNTLHEQVMTKEKELQAALQRQERYQHTVQELTAKMERAYMKLSETPASMAAPPEAQMAEYKETLADIESICEDIEKVKDNGQLIVDSPDSEGHKAMEATLTMLSDRFNNLQAMADNKGRQLKEVVKDREKHNIALKAYKNRVGDLRSWMEEARVRQANSGRLSEDPEFLQTHLDENKTIQEQVNLRLQQLSDLALQCDALCAHEPPAVAEKLRNELATLQNDLGQFKMTTIEKQAKLRASIKDAEKRKREMEELDSSVQRLQKWMSDTKEMTRGPEHEAVIAPPEIHKELATDLKKHKQLVHQISKQGLWSAPAVSKLKPMADKEIRESWEKLSRELAQKTRNLEDLLRTKKPGDLVKVSLYASARHADSTKQLEEVKSIMGEMGDCWNQLQTQLDDKQLQLDEALSFQQQYQSALQNVSSWLDLSQQQVFTAPSTTEEHIRQNENLQKEIRSLQYEVASMSDQADELASSTGGVNQDLIHDCLASLNNRIKLLEETTEAQAEDLRKASRQWKQYQAEVMELQRQLQDTQKLVLAPVSMQSLDQLITNNQNIEAQLKKCEAQLKELKAKEANLTDSYPKGVFLSELVTHQSNFMELQRRAQEKKASLQKSVSVQDQYQKMLKDYASFVDTAQDKLKNDSISARDLNHLKQQLTSHKDFFSDMEVHKAILDSLAGQCDETTRKKYQAQHSSLSSLTHVLVDQASLHGQRLERLTRQWIDLDEKHIQLQKTLSSLQAQVPHPIASGDSLATIQNKLSTYKRLQSELTNERANVFEVVERGKQILHSINCSTLEAAVTDLADKWVSLNTDLPHELKRTKILGDQLSTFEADAAIFLSWLNTAKMTCASFKQLSSSDLQNIGAIRSKVEKVLEFRKEVENQLPLKNRVIKVGNELMQNKNYDTRGLSERLTFFEEEWSQLESGIGETEEFLHQAQMDLMPSRQALTELNNWMDDINRSLKTDANKRISSVADIEVMVKKYKGYKIELASKQMTLDFVNQSVLAPSPEETDVPHEKLDFAEKLGDLNKRWEKVLKAVNDRLAALEGVQSKWDAYEQTLQRLQVWIKDQEDKIKRYKLIGQEVGVKQTLRDCKSMQQQLQSKQVDLTNVKTLGKDLISAIQESPGCQQSVRESLSSVDQNWKRLEEQTRQLENLLTDILGQWARYHTDLASLNQVLTQTEYYLGQYTLIGGDISFLRSQVTKLKGLQSELKKHLKHLESFVRLATQLRQVCEPPVQVDIQKTVADIQTKWKKLKADLLDRCSLFELSLAQWEEYETQYRKIIDWLNAKEQLCSELITMRDDPTRRQESLSKSKELQEQLDNIQSQLSHLYDLSDHLTKNMNTSTIVILTSRQSAIDQRLLALRQILSQHMATLSEDLSQLGQFNEAFDVVNKFLLYAESVLSPADPTKAAEQEHIQLRLEQLNRLLSQFTSNMIRLDNVNDLGYRLALNTIDAARLKELNHRWQDSQENAKERARTLQANLLIQQDFTTKCEAWMIFLAQTEQDLAIEVKANLPDLREQLKNCEQFESEIYSRQQILHAIISDGQKMMKAGEVEGTAEFEQKLQLLAEQWQNVLRRANERKTIIESLIKQWQQFNSMSRQLLLWLKDKENVMKVFEFDSTSLQSVRNLVEKVKTTEREFNLQEGSFKQIHDLGNNLLRRVDAAPAEEIRMTLDTLQKSWFNVFSQLDAHRSRLEGVDRQWIECEEDIEDILSWLKDIRHGLHADIPSSYDELQS